MSLQDRWTRDLNEMDDPKVFSRPFPVKHLMPGTNMEVTQFVRLEAAVGALPAEGVANVKQWLDACAETIAHHLDPQGGVDEWEDTQ